MRSGLFLPLFGELAEPAVVAGLAAEAEAAGWAGVFVWDHIQYRSPVTAVADPWITLAAIATRTEQVTLGPMVTPITRRRPQKLARETVSLDRLSGGRLVLGVGLGADTSGELSAFGEDTEPRRLGQRLDEGLELLEALWSGDQVRHRGEAFMAEGVQFLPMAVQQPRIPVWVAARYPHRAPLRRAARYEGLFPIELTRPDDLVEMLAEVAGHRTSSNALAVATQGWPGDDPRPWADAGATWWLVRFDPFTVSADHVRGVITDGPPIRRDASG